MKRLESGFTLLEILLVMLLVGLMAGVALPQLGRLVQGVTAATERDAMIAELSHLSYRLYTLGQSFELSDGSASVLLQDGSPALRVEPGWQLDVPQPIRFSALGVCSGGELTLRAPSGELLRLALAAPACKVSYVAEVN